MAWISSGDRAGGQEGAAPSGERWMFHEQRVAQRHAASRGATSVVCEGMEYFHMEKAFFLSEYPFSPRL